MLLYSICEIKCRLILKEKVMRKTKSLPFKELIQDRGYTQELLAYVLGVSQQTVSGWVCGVTRPKIKQLVEIAKVLGVTVNDVYQSLEEEI